MPPSFEIFLQTALEIITLFFLLVGLVGLIFPIFPGLTIMWFATLIYAIVQWWGEKMTGWDWFLFAIITILMVVGNFADNFIIASKMRERYIPWTPIILAFTAGILVSIFLTPLVGLIAAPLALFLAEWYRLKDKREALQSTKIYMIGWGWAFGVRFAIGIAIIGSWMLWAWI